MTDLLVRIFAGTEPDYTLPETRAKIGRMAGITGIICNLLLSAGKLAAGIIAGSVSIIADALNNLSDAASSIVTLLGFHMAQRPADEDHPYGHARYEYLAGLVMGALILVIGLELGKNSVVKILHPQPVTPSVITAVILVCSIGVKLWMCFFFRTLGSRIRSGTLRAAAADSRNDVAATGAVLLGFLISSIWGVNLDGYFGLAVAAFILYSGYQIASETVSLLLGTRVDKALEKKLSSLILSHEKVLGIHDLLVHDYGPGQCFASVHAEISADEGTLDCHDIVDDIECDVMEQLNVHLVIHIDPVRINDRTWEAMRALAQQAVTDVDPRMTIHDFRIVTHEGTEMIAFDLGVPYDLEAPDEVIREGIAGKLAACGAKYPAMLHIDRKP